MYDDLGADGVAETGDYGELDGRPTLGEPNFDRTDVDESDQIGLTSFNYFSPANLYPAREDEELWEQLKPGFYLWGRVFPLASWANRTIFCGACLWK